MRFQRIGLIFILFILAASDPGQAGLNSTILAPVKSFIENSLSKQIGRAVIIKDLYGNPLSELTAQGISIANSEDPSSGSLFKLDKIVLKYKPLKMFSEKASLFEIVDSITIVRPTFYLNKEKSGQWSFSNEGSETRQEIMAKPAIQRKPQSPSMQKTPSKAGNQPDMFAGLKGKLIIDSGKLILTDLSKRIVAKVDDIQGNLDFNQGRFKFTAVSNDHSQADIFLRGDFNLKTGETSGRVKVNTIDLSSYSDFLTFLPVELKKGYLTAELNLESGQGTLETLLDRLIPAGKIQVTGAQVLMPPLKDDFKDVNLEMSITKDFVQIDSLIASIAGSSCAVSGKIMDFKNPIIHMDITSKQIPLDIFKDYIPLKNLTCTGEVDIVGSVNGPLNAPRVDFGLIIQQAKINNLDFVRTSLTGSFNGGLFALKDFKADCLGGSLSGSGKINFKYGNNPELALKFNADGIDLATVKAVFFNQYDLAGKVDASVEISGNPTKLHWEGHANTLGPFSVFGKQYSALTAEMSGGSDSAKCNVATADGRWKIGGALRFDKGRLVFDKLRSDLTKVQVSELAPLIRPWVSLDNVSGSLSLSLLVDGNQDLPTMSGELALRNGMLNRFNYDFIDIPVDYQGGVFQLSSKDDASKSVVVQASGKKVMTISGALPLVWSKKGQEAIQGREMSLRVMSPEGDLGLLAALPGVAEANGQIQIDLGIRGTYANPIITGTLFIRGGRIIPENIYLVKKGIHERGHPIEDINIEVQTSQKTDPVDGQNKNYFEFKRGEGRVDRTFNITGYLWATQWLPDSYKVRLVTDHDQGVTFNYLPEIMRGYVDADITFQKGMTRHRLGKDGWVEEKDSAPHQEVWGNLNLVDTALTYSPQASALASQAGGRSFLDDTEWNIKVGFRKRLQYVNQDGIGRLAQGAFGLKGVDVKLITNIAVDMDTDPARNFILLGGRGPVIKTNGFIYFIKDKGQFTYINTQFSVQDKQSSSVDTSINANNPASGSASTTGGNLGQTSAANNNVYQASSEIGAGEKNRSRLELIYSETEKKNKLYLFIYGKTNAIKNSGIKDPATVNTPSPKDLDSVTFYIALRPPNPDEMREKGSMGAEELPFVVEFSSSPAISNGDIATYLTLGKSFSGMQGQNFQQQSIDALTDTSFRYFFGWFFRSVSGYLSWLADVVAVRQTSEKAQEDTNTTATVSPQAVTQTAIPQANQTNVASLLKNVEFELGKNFTSNLYVNYKLVLLDQDPSVVTTVGGVWYPPLLSMFWALPSMRSLVIRSGWNTL